MRSVSASPEEELPPVWEQPASDSISAEAMSSASVLFIQITLFLFEDKTKIPSSE